MFVSFGIAVEHRADHQQGKQPQRQINVEDPAPRGMLHDKPADQRPNHRCQPKYAAEEPLIAAALGRRDHIGHRCHADHHQSAAA